MRILIAIAGILVTGWMISLVEIKGSAPHGSTAVLRHMQDCEYCGGTEEGKGWMHCPELKVIWERQRVKSESTPSPAQSRTEDNPAS